jgi:hypothetical protein
MNVRKMYRLFVVWRSFLKPTCPLARRPLSSAQLFNRAYKIMENTLASTGPIVIPFNFQITRHHHPCAMHE